MGTNKEYEKCKTVKLEHMKTHRTLIQYVDKKGARYDKNKPAVGVMIAYKDPITGDVKFGWSKCDDCDTFNKNVAFVKALKRVRLSEESGLTNSFDSDNTPHNIWTAHWHFQDRANRYFNKED